MNIKELAKKLDLSITTVSRALGGYSDVSETTRQRVKKFAIKYQYSPNPYARPHQERLKQLDTFFQFMVQTLVP